jgi:pyruvate formate lyase activating enzyme
MAMDQEIDAPANQSAGGGQPAPLPRRQLLKYGLYGLASASAGGSALYYLNERARSITTAAVFKHDAPDDALWQLWQAKGWVREARHYRKLGQNVQCLLCPNGCVLEPGDRSHCRDRVNRAGTLYTLAYANPCAMHVDPIEKKPLFHFLPGAAAFSIATAGCGFRCLNCQNWDISQSKPEERKDPQGPLLRPRPDELNRLTAEGVQRMTLMPADVVAAAEAFQCRTIAYTYSEPIVWYEYMFDTARAARAKGIKNLWITCGFIEPRPLAELCQYLDAANVNLKSFSDDVYRQLNSGRLQPILDTLLALKRAGVWFEVTNLIVPTYTDKPQMIRQMCHWLLDNIGPDYPLHFSRFFPKHKLDHLPPTPVKILVEAREIARDVGLRYVYIGNVPELDDGETTSCPHCHRTLIVRQYYSLRQASLEHGACECGTKIPGVWS